MSDIRGIQGELILADERRSQQASLRLTILPISLENLSRLVTMTMEEVFRQQLSNNPLFLLEPKKIVILQEEPS